MKYRMQSVYAASFDITIFSWLASAPRPDITFVVVDDEILTLEISATGKGETLMLMKYGHQLRAIVDY